MFPDYKTIKGVHPGAILKHELKKRNLRSKHLAESIGEYPQTINAITKERRGMNPKLSFKLGKYFEIAEEYFMLLQAAFEVSAIIKAEKSIPNPLIGKFRAAIFWDTSIESIDYKKNKRYVIQRILERGNQEEINELITIYSLPVIKYEIKNIGSSFLPKYKRNIEKYIIMNK